MNTSSDQYEVVAVRYATQETLRSEVFLNYFAYGEPDAVMSMDYYFWIIRNQHRTIVVDTGCRADVGKKRNVRQLVAPSEALSLLSVDPDEATVVLTHAHFDHAGNLDAFPHSVVVMSAAEYSFWTGPFARRQQYHLAVEDRDIDQLRSIEQEGRLQLRSGTTSVAPGIDMIEVGGHSPGQCVLTVDTSEGLVVLASDAAHFREEIDRDMPFFVVSDLTAMYAGYDLLGDFARSDRAIVVPGHDPEVLRAHRSHGGDLAGICVSIGHLADPGAPTTTVAEPQRPPVIDEG